MTSTDDQERAEICMDRVENMPESMPDQERVALSAMQRDWFEWLGSLIRSFKKPTAQDAWQAAWAAGVQYERRRAEVASQEVEELRAACRAALHWWEFLMCGTPEGIEIADMLHEALSSAARPGGEVPP